MILFFVVIVLIHRTDAGHFNTVTNNSPTPITDVFARGSSTFIGSQYLATVTLNHSARVLLPLIFSIEKVETLPNQSFDDQILQRKSLVDIASVKSLSLKSGDGNCIEASKGNVSLAKRYCIYTFGGHVNITSKGLPSSRFEVLRHGLQIVITDSNNDSTKRLLVVNAVEECFPMTYYYNKIRSTCPQDVRRFTSLHEETRWPTNRFQIFVNGGILIGKIQVRTNFTTLFSNGNYTVVVEANGRNYVQLFEYRRYRGQSEVLGKRSAFFPRVHGKQIDIFFVEEIFIEKGEMVSLSISSNLHGTPVDFYGDEAITLFGSLHLQTCPGITCMRYFEKWKNGVVYLTELGSVECTGDPNMYLSYLSNCKGNPYVTSPTRIFFKQKIPLKCHGVSGKNADHVTWLKNGQLLDGKTGFNLELSGLDFIQQGFYQCQLTKHGALMRSKEVLVKFEDVVKTRIYFEMRKIFYKQQVKKDGRFDVDVNFKSKVGQLFSKYCTSFVSVSMPQFINSHTNWYGVQFIANSQLKPNTTFNCIYDYLQRANITEILHPFEIREDSSLLHDSDFCLPDVTGEISSYGVYFWKYSPADVIAKQPCRKGVENVKRECKKGGGNQFSLWLLPNTSACKYVHEITEKLGGLLTNISQDQSTNAIPETLARTKDLLRNKTLTSDDTVIVKEILKNAVNLSTNLSGPVVQNILEIVDDLFATNVNTLVVAQERDQALNSIISSVESIAFKLHTNISNTCSHTKQVSSADVAVATVRNINTMSSEKVTILVQSKSSSGIGQPSFSFSNDVDFPDKPDYFVRAHLPTSVLSNSISLVYYTRPILFPSIVKAPFRDRVDDSKKVIGGVLGVLLNKQKNVDLTKDFVYEMAMDDKIEGAHLHCVFWDFQANDGFGDWSMQGCTKVQGNRKTLTCSCNHLTNFAVLFDARTTTTTTSQLDKKHEFALSLITYIGCAFSLTGILLTMITLCLFKFLRRNTPSKVLLCLCTSLGLLMIIFVSLVERTKPRWLCTTTSILLHYFVLMTFGWMFVEAFTLYLKVVKITGEFSSRFLLKASLATAGLPTIIVACCYLLRKKDYTSKKYCITSGKSLYYGLLTPVCLVLLTNFAIFSLVVKTLHKSRRKTQIYSQGTSLTAQMRIAVSCCTLLGLTWLFGILAINDARLPFQYAFCILNSLQGCFIFYFNIARQSRVREAWKNYFSGHGTSYEPTTLSTASRLKIVAYSEEPTLRSLETHDNETFEYGSESNKPNITFTSFVERNNR